MLIPQSIIERYRYRYVMCIDPGTTTMGVAILRIDTFDINIKYIYTTTLYPAELVKIKGSLDYLSDCQSHKLARLAALTEMLEGLMRTFCIKDVCIEDAYSAINVSTYATLIECQSAIRSAALAISPDISITLIKSSQAKKLAGVKGNSGDKELVRQAIRTRLFDFLDENINIDAITEHECDAIIIGFFYFTQSVSDGVLVPFT